ncbi:hypothetical protein [Streptomyces venezuelae]|uniref:hypothetical protein n=1 Tax=Streptomyces venezuelae TaxID=54571 RepID=UPI003657966B
MRTIQRAVLGTAAALAALTGALTPTASATSTVADGCPVTAWNHVGRYMCGTNLRAGYVDWNRDRKTDEVFVIGPNRKIYHTWAAAGGWKEMPGGGRADDMLGASETGNPSRRCVIVYVNRGFHYWQNCFYSGKWHNWTHSG